MTPTRISPLTPKLVRTLCALVLTLPAITSALPAGAAPSDWPPECVEGSLPSNDPDYPAEQLILTCLPQDWNGELVVYTHGYTPIQSPLALPEDELVLSNGQSVPGVLLALGFAFATSSYHKNGYAVEQAVADLNALVDYFKTEVAPGPVTAVYLTGASEGGIVTATLIERFPATYTGGLALCGPVGGSPFEIKYVSDFRVVFDYFFPDVFPFGAADVPPDAYLDWDSTYAPAITQAIQSDPQATDQLFAVTRAARVPGDEATAVSTAVNLLWYSIWGSHDLAEVSGGQPFDNTATVYRGSANDAALNAGVERVTGDPAAQAYMRQFYQTTGRLRRPLVTLHTALDEIVPASHELIYRALVTRAGRGENLTLLGASRYGHCNFTPGEVIGAFLLMLGIN